MVLAGREMECERFDDWDTAYQVCRDRKRSLLAKVGTEKARIWPNGEYQLLESEREATGGRENTDSTLHVHGDSCDVG